jgi:O-acetyl-ADP-ribose deacetylase (regulator of RNase III)
MSKIKEVYANLLTFPKVKVIAHQANCQNTMGSGIARSIREMYPVAYAADSNAAKLRLNRLGNISIAYTSATTKDSKIIINLYGQDLYGRDSRKTNYEAVYCALEKIKDFLVTNKHTSIGFPKLMGCALGGGNWNIVRVMIEEVFADFDGDVYIVEFKP